MPGVIGIDLGTTNCALASAVADRGVEVFEIPQLVNAGEVRAEPLLPSFLYLAGPGDFPGAALDLPWPSDPARLVGALAQKRGAENAGRLVASAKSWLCYGSVDRTGAILPAAAPEGVERVSPVEASRRYLEHLREAWDAAHPETPVAAQQTLITVPASFDAVARELTLEAAREAGYRDVVLLEEPQAAFYAWLERHPDWRERVKPGDLILVADIGGGTTDFTLIAVSEAQGELTLERIAVGEHILLGGDNIDLALARHAESGFPKKLDALQFQALWQQCRVAKEKLLDPDGAAKEHPLTVLGRGSGLVGGTMKGSLKRADLERIVLEGFLPQVASTDLPARRSAGLMEEGLPYAADPAITRHLAKFLRQPAANAEHGAVRRTKSGLAAPTHVLFNGGVLRGGLIRQRLLAVLHSWLQEEKAAPVEPLQGEDLMHAVARGAAYFGLVRQGKGIRIRGGVPRTYYIGIETALPAVPGMRPPLKALTVAPFGMEEGTRAELPNRQFRLTVGEPAQFRFLVSSERKNDAAGAMIEELDAGFEELAPIEVTLEGTAGESVPVSLEAEVTETGMLQLWCAARDGRRWKLEFNVREPRKR